MVQKSFYKWIKFTMRATTITRVNDWRLAAEDAGARSLLMYRIADALARLSHYVRLSDHNQLVVS